MSIANHSNLVNKVWNYAHVLRDQPALFTVAAYLTC